MGEVRAAGSVRTARNGDEQALLRLICNLEQHEFAPYAFYARLHAQWADGRHTCLVYEADGVVVGMLNLRIDQQLHHERPTAEILELVVDASQRGRGVGAQLFDAARERAVAARCEILEVSSNVRRAAAHRFYEREGMVRSHVHLTMEL